MTTPAEAEAINVALRSAGIPNSSIVTTLPKEGCLAIRDYLVRKDYTDGADYRGMFVYPNRVTKADKARRVFLTIAKELQLMDVPVYCLSLTRLVAAITFDESGSRDADRIESANMVFVTDFYEHDAPFPLLPWQAGVTRSWIKDRMDNGKGISLLSDVVMSQMTKWWPPSFSMFIEGKTKAFIVE